VGDTSADRVRIHRTGEHSVPGLTVSSWALEDVADVAMITATGTIGNPTVTEFQNFLDPLLQDGKVKRLILNFSGLAEMSSVGLGYISTIRERLVAAGGEVVLVGVQGKVRVVLKMLGLLAVFREFEKKEDAFRALLKPGP
jgi:anti-anti-sigma factor